MSTDDPRISEAEFDLDRYMAQCRAAYAMLNQDTHWVDLRGRIHRLADMSVRYKANCLAFMRKPGRVKWFADRYVWGELSSLNQPTGWREVDAGGEPFGPQLSRGEMAGLGDFGNMDAAHDEYIEALDARIKADPERWLDETPLMKALSAQVLAGEGGAVGERPEDEPRTVTGDTPCPNCGRGAGNLERHRRSGPLARLCSGEWVLLTRYI